MEENSLLPLSHTTCTTLSHNTPRTHTHPPANPSPTAADDTSDVVRLLVDGEHGREVPTHGPKPIDFNLSEFLALANRVVDEGDADSLAALETLKRQWVEKFGDGGSATPEMGLKPVATRQPTPFPPSLRVPRRAIHNIGLPVPDREPPPLLTPADFDPMEAQPNPAVGEEAAPTRVLGIQPESMQIRVLPVIEREFPQPLLTYHADGAAPPPRALGASTDHNWDRPMTPAAVGVGGGLRSSVAAGPTGGPIPISFSGPTNDGHCTVVPPKYAAPAAFIRHVIRNSAKRWSTTVVGYFLGKRPFFHHVNEFVRSVWPMVREVKATSNGFFFFEFNTVTAMEEVIEGGPWLFRGQPIVLQKWEPGMMLRKLQHTQVPVWIKLRHLPVELWTAEGLSTVASGIGKPLYPDAITRACTRLDFARVCVMLDISSKLPKHIVIMVPKEEGGESACKVDVEYEWLPPKYNACISLVHPTKECPTTRPKHPPVSVYVQKQPVPSPRE
ncbi:UNVERIFIED_CONTAM: hypothetical protein Slati_0893100 [Sesamum latifolium]|uniref:DUF4283 domain-containing protein n=1 Tax=Sesamum latifolium TaxID=2727402 RepID=A0AAW2XN15_9LAMI